MNEAIYPKLVPHKARTGVERTCDAGSAVEARARTRLAAGASAGTLNVAISFRICDKQMSDTV